jgi:hypothetical protein
MKRKHFDNVKPGKGIDGSEGESWTKDHNVPNRRGDSYPGGDDGERSQPGAYTSNRSGLTQGTDFQFSAASRDIFDDVTENQDQNVSSDPHNKITAGVNRSQSDE